MQSHKRAALNQHALPWDPVHGELTPDLHKVTSTSFFFGVLASSGEDYGMMYGEGLELGPF